MGDKEEKTIRVVDRRMFTPDGDLRPDFVPEESSPSEAPSPPPAAPASSSAPSPSSAGPVSGAASRPGGSAAASPQARTRPAGSAETAEAAEAEAPEDPEHDSSGDAAREPRGDFAAIVRSLATTAYSALGLLDPSGPRHREPAVARQMIDWLAVLESKTRNNLSFEESDFLSRVLYELRLAFVEVTRPPGASR